MSARLEMMAADYERRGREARDGAEQFRGRPAFLRAAQATARKYEREAAELRAIIARNAAARVSV